MLKVMGREEGLEDGSGEGSPVWEGGSVVGNHRLWYTDKGFARIVTRGEQVRLEEGETGGRKGRGLSPLEEEKG